MKDCTRGHASGLMGEKQPSLETDLDLLSALTKIKDGADWRLWAKLFIFCFLLSAAANTLLSPLTEDERPGPRCSCCGDITSMRPRAADLPPRRHPNRRRCHRRRRRRRRAGCGAKRRERLRPPPATSRGRQRGSAPRPLPPAPPAPPRRPGAPAGRCLDPGRGPPAPASPLPLLPSPRPAPA